MKKIFIIICCIAVTVFAGIGIKYVMTPVNSQKLEYTVQEDLESSKGVIIRDEWIMYSKSAGTMYSSLSDGERVSKDSFIGMFFYGDASGDKINELAAVDRELKNAVSAKDNSLVSENDPSNIESNISKLETGIINASAVNDIRTVSEYKEDINGLRQNNSYLNKNSAEELENRRNGIINSIGINKDDITAQISGVFTTYIDGCENTLKIEDIENYDVNYFEGLPQSFQNTKIENRVNFGEPICKIVNNHVWYVMIEVPAQAMKDRKIGDDVKVRFNNSASESAKGSIVNISDEVNGKMIVTVKSSDYIESVFSYRIMEVDLIFKSYEGYKVPIHSIRTEENGKQKIIGINGSGQYNCYCDVLFTNTDEGYAIVESSENAEHKISQMERILVGER